MPSSLTVFPFDLSQQVGRQYLSQYLSSFVRFCHWSLKTESVLSVCLAVLHSALLHTVGNCKVNWLNWEDKLWTMSDKWGSCKLSTFVMGSGDEKWLHIEWNFGKQRNKFAQGLFEIHVVSQACKFSRSRLPQIGGL